MAEVKPGWKTLEGQAGVAGAISVIVVAVLTAYLGLTAEQASVIAAGIVTAGGVLWKLIEARRSVKESAARVAVAEIMTAPPPAAAPPVVTDPSSVVTAPSHAATPPSLLITPDPYGREGDPIDRP